MQVQVEEDTGAHTYTYVMSKGANPHVQITSKEGMPL